jgi:hypothetical protein
MTGAFHLSISLEEVHRVYRLTIYPCFKVGVAPGGVTRCTGVSDKVTLVDMLTIGYRDAGVVVIDGSQ